MCPCDPNDNNLNPGPFPPYPEIPGFGIPFAPPAIPFPDISLPDGVPEDILKLLEDLVARIPGGPFIPNPTTWMRNVLDAIASLLNQLAPYLAFYKFIQALLNIVLCLIDVLCSLFSPIALIRAMRRLFKRCLPDFLSLFPWLALLAMIIALLLLLLALLLYILEQILKFIRDLFNNLLALAKTLAGQGTSDDILAAVRKIAGTLCLLESLFAILIAFQAILAIIEALAALAGRTVCSKRSRGDDLACCDDSVCPPFIAQNPEGISGTSGRLIYHNEVLNDTSSLSSFFPGLDLQLPAIRGERWQFTDDDDSKDFKFKDIITEIDGNIFWPEGRSYEADSNVKKVPYTLDLTINTDPAFFGHDDNPTIFNPGPRNFIIKDVRILKKPTIGTLNYQTNLDASDGINGGLIINGGLVYESDGSTPFLIGGAQATFSQFIHRNPTIGAPFSEDGYEFFNVEYEWKINHAALLEQGIITLGCIPEIDTETAIVTVTTPNFDPIVEVLSNLGGNLPNVAGPGGTVDCLSNALAELRRDVSVENVAIFQATVEQCIGDLQADTLAAYTAAVTAGTSPYTSTVVLDPEVQFISRPIDVTVQLKDPGGTVISFRVPEEAQDDLAAKIQGQVTFGQISDFEFDGYESFTAQITSDAPGDGELRVSFDNNIFSLVVNRDDDTVPSSIEENVLTYSFVGTPVRFGGLGGEPEPMPRRDEGDVARDGD